MADRRRPTSAVALPLLFALGLMLALPLAASAAPARSVPVGSVLIADAPPNGGEDCVDDPDAHPGTGLRECPKGFDVATLLPFVGGGVLVVLAAVVGWFLVMRRRASRPFLPDEAIAGTTAGGAAGGRPASAGGGEWWTCQSCGSTNMVGSARCYKCGSWQR